MVWAPTDVWSVDHIIPQEDAKELACVYDNLVLACQCCNRMKSSHRVANPCLVAYGQCLHVSSDGAIVALNKVGDRLLRVLRWRPTWASARTWAPPRRARRMRELHALALCDPEGYEQVMGFPAELPDLINLKVKSNSRPEGINDSWLAKRVRGELPKVY